MIAHSGFDGPEEDDDSFEFGGGEFGYHFDHASHAVHFALECTLDPTVLGVKFQKHRSQPGYVVRVTYKIPGYFTNLMILAMSIEQLPSDLCSEMWARAVVLLEDVEEEVE